MIGDEFKADLGKPRLDLVPPDMIEAVGTVMTFGANKYGVGNWKKVEPDRYRAALMRHICAYLRDPYGKAKGSGLPNRWHIATNAAFLCELERGE